MPRDRDSHPGDGKLRSEVEPVTSLDAVCFLAEQGRRMVRTKSHAFLNVAVGTIKVAARTEVMGELIQRG